MAALTIEQYECPEGQDVIRYIVNNGSHAWPGGEKGTKLGDSPSSSLDATKVIFDFFMAHSKQD